MGSYGIYLLVICCMDMERSTMLFMEKLTNFPWPFFIANCNKLPEGTSNSQMKNGELPSSCFFCGIFPLGDPLLGRSFAPHLSDGGESKMLSSGYGEPAKEPLGYPYSLYFPKGSRLQLPRVSKPSNRMSRRMSHRMS